MDQDELICENNRLKERVKHLEEELAEQKRLRKDVENRMVVNSKTGFPNRYQLKRDLVIFLAEAGNDKRQNVSVIILKLDKKYDMLLKTMKQSVSEWILYQTAIRIEETLTEFDRIYHTQDDEFIIILRRIDGQNSIEEIMEAINDAVIEPYILSGQNVSIGCSAGISVFPGNGDNKSDLLRNADIALGSAVRCNLPFQVFNPDLQSEVINKMDLQNHLTRALEAQAANILDKQFELFYQPIVTISGIQGENVLVDKIEAEVLIRWNHPQRGVVMPGDFIPLAEETGLILPMGNWVMYSAITQLEKWRDTVYSDIILSINFSPKQFGDEFVAGNIIEVLGKEKYLAEHVKVEITESCLIDDPIASIEKMKKLRDNDIQISIDDFGSGYSSLNYLRQLPVNNIKIDKSFIKNIHKTKQDFAISRAIIALGQELNFHIICEGVEELEQIKTAYNEGCRTFQGYYFSKPIPAAEFEVLVDKLRSSMIKTEENFTA